MKHLFCISSPFQADSARRIIEYFSIPVDDVKILLFDHAFQKDRDRVKTSLGWLYGKAKIKNIEYKTNSILRRIKFVKKEAPAAPFFVYSGDWNNKLPKFFSLHPYFKGFKAMDDGIASFAIAEKAQRSCHFYNFFKRLKPEFISRYDISEMCPSFNVKYLPPKNHIKEYSSSVLVIGCPVVEKNIMTEEDYSFFLEKVRAEFLDRDIFYYPHRHENEKKMPDIFIETESEQPIESWFDSQRVPPGTIISLFSSALINIKADHPEVLAYYYEPEASLIVSRNEDIHKFYRRIEKLPAYNRFL